MSRMNQRRLAVESLESKQLLAGDVTVSVVGGNVHIRGDEAANQIVVTAGTESGSFVIQGLEGTTVKLAGSTAPAPETGLVVTGVRNLVNISMAGGDDAVTVQDAEFRRGLTIATGAGNDEVIMQNVSVGGALSVLTGAGDDTVEIGVALSPEASATAVDSAANVRAAAAIDVALGDGVDSVEINSASARGAIVVGGGPGGDAIGLHGVRAAAILARGGDGDGVDEIELTGAKAAVAIIGTGEGADEVSIADSAFTSLNVALGSGDDSLSLQGVKARVAVLAGGAGSADESADAGDNTLNRRVVTGFEIPEGVNTPLRPLLAGRFGLLAGLLDRLRS